MKKVLIAATLALFSPFAANATITTYSFLGVLDNGAAFAGSFNDDDSLLSYGQFSNIKVNVGSIQLNGIDSIETAYPYSGTSEFHIRFYDPAHQVYISNQYLEVIFDATHTDFTIEAIPTQSLNAFTTFADGYEHFSEIASGTISSAPAATVLPEPAVWVMFIGGFGLVGGVMRRRRVKVTFA